MKRLLALIVMLVIGVTAEAQPQHYNALPTTGANTFPFNINANIGKKVQWIVAAGEFTQPSTAPAARNISSIWFRANTAGNATYNTLTIRMASVSTSTFLSTGAFYSGPMTTVRSQSTTIAPTGPLTWVSIPLTTPFFYDPALNLIIEVSHCGFSGTGFNLPQQTFGTAPNFRRIYSDASSACGVTALPTAGDNFVAGIGIGFGPPLNVFTITGPPPPDSFGFGNQALLVEGWSQTVTYSNVSIAMPLQDNTSGGPIASPGLQGTIYLMNQIGPGATSANQVVPPVQITGLVAADPVFETRTPFSGLTLPPGNYYVVWVPAHTSPLSMSPQGGGSTMTVTSGFGVTALGSSSSLTPALFPPATSITLNPPGNLWVRVTGNRTNLAPIPMLLLD